MVYHSGKVVLCEPRTSFANFAVKDLCSTKDRHPRVKVMRSLLDFKLAQKIWRYVPLPMLKQRYPQASEFAPLRRGKL